MPPPASAAPAPVPAPPTADAGASVVAPGRARADSANLRQALQQQTLSQHFAAIVASSDDAIISKTLDGIVTSWNPAAERIFGWRADEMLGRPMTTVFPPERMDEERVILARIARGEKVEHFETVRLHKNGQPVQVSVTISPIVDDHGQVVGASKIARDIGEQIKAKQTIWQQAHFDPLTGLPNRRLFAQRLHSAIERALQGTQEVALVFIDLDGFKHVNDNLGHAAGDDLLVQVAARLRGCLRAGDEVARLGGDEFTVMLTAVQGLAEVDTVCRRLGEVLRRPFTLGQDQVRVSGSLGVALWPHQAPDAETLMRHADLAMYEAKQQGRDRIRHFTDSMRLAVERRQRLMDDLRGALLAGELDVHYHPVVRVADGRPVGVEAALRWQHPVLGQVPPSDFFDLAEETGQVHALGDWLFETALRQLAAWRQQTGLDLSLTLGVSTSVLHTVNSKRAQRRELLQSLGLSQSVLVTELRESVVASHDPDTESSLLEMRSRGTRVAVRHFGTGSVCLADLQRLQVNQLKLAPRLVHQLRAGSAEQALADGLVALGSRLGLTLVAPDVQTAEQQQLLLQMGCHLMQGPWVAPAMAAGAATAWLMARRGPDPGAATVA